MLAPALLLISAGLGPLAGTLALAFHTTGVLGRQFAEAIENAPDGPAFALQVQGVPAGRAFLYSTFPQALPQLVSYTLYRFESNVRSATVVGMVGAGGIGMVLWELIRSFAFEQTCAVMTLIVLVVVVFDMLSQQLRKRVL